MKTSAEFQERYGRLEESSRDFDVRFWQEAGDTAIFNAAQQLILDYTLIRKGHAEQPDLKDVLNFFRDAEVRFPMNSDCAIMK